MLSLKDDAVGSTCMHQQPQLSQAKHNYWTEQPETEIQAGLRWNILSGASSFAVFPTLSPTSSGILANSLQQVG